MTAYNLIKRENTYYVEGLRDEWCGAGSNDTMLLVIYDAGDCDTVRQNDELMHRALYDLFQTNDQLEDGDVFILAGKPVYRCEDVHVVAVE